MPCHAHASYLPFSFLPYYPSLQTKKMSVEEKASLVFIPFPMLSHLTAAVAAAKLLSERDKRLAITVLIMKFPGDTKITSYINNFSKSQSRINFIHLEESQPTSEEKAASESPGHDIFRFIESQKKAVTGAVSKIIESRKLKRMSGFVIDMLCFSMIDVANDFGAPTYVFFACSAASVGFMVDLQNLKDDHDQDLTVYDGSDFEISVSTFVNPVPAKVWPASTFIKGRVFPDPFITRFKEIKGIMVNTFLEFEHHTIRSVSDNQNIPPIYPIGPILGDERDEDDEVLGWLDEQPNSSVLFLCFGSLGFFEKEQVREIAKALEQSKQRFLWSLRKPPTMEKENADEVLPEGFVDRVNGMGRVIEWAPQKAVLAHPAVGGFVSHCGWNSILESVWFGVPIATFPLFAEQQMNAFQLVKEFGMGEMIRLDYHKDMMGVKMPEIVGAEEIEAAIRRLMAEEGGSGVREKVKEMQKKARSALLEGGSSYNAMSLFIEDVIRFHPES